MLSNLFRSADLDSQFSCLLKQGFCLFHKFCPCYIQDIEILLENFIWRLICFFFFFCSFFFFLTLFVAAVEIPSTPLSQIREQVTNVCVNILHSYRKFCATVSSSGQLILPEALKLLPLYTLGIPAVDKYMRTLS